MQLAHFAKTIQARNVKCCELVFFASLLFAVKLAGERAIKFVSARAIKPAVSPSFNLSSYCALLE